MSTKQISEMSKKIVICVACNGVNPMWLNEIITSGSVREDIINSLCDRHLFIAEKTIGIILGES